MSGVNRSWWSIRSKLLLELGAVVLLVIAVASTLLWLRNPGGNEQSNGSTLAEGQPAPAFSLPDATGETVSLSEFSGKPVLLYFSMGYG